MIYDHLDNLVHYKSCINHAEIISNYLKQHPLNTLPEGKTVINNEVFIMKFALPDLTALETCYEQHHDYIDIHIVIDGSELISYLPQKHLLNQCSAEFIDDCRLNNSSATAVEIHQTPNYFALFYPCEWHKPKQILHHHSITKVVIKVYQPCHSEL